MVVPIFVQIKQLRDGCQIVVGTPGRVNDLAGRGGKAAAHPVRRARQTMRERWRPAHRGYSWHHRHNHE